MTMNLKYFKRFDHFCECMLTFGLREFEAARDCAVILLYLRTGIANQVAHKCIMNLPTKLYYTMGKKNENVNISTTGNGFGNKKKSICFVTFYAIYSRKINGFCFFFSFLEKSIMLCIGASLREV